MMRILTFAAIVWAALTGLAAAETLRLAITTSVQNSGLADRLFPALEAATGLRVDLVVVGTGQALRLGRAGDVDAVLVHSRAAEEAFVAQGFATHRREIMFNDFVLIGPKDDPAGIAGADNAPAALAAIATARQPFVSRGDDSGTHRKEIEIWGMTGAPPPSGRWYNEAGAGMGATLNIAAGLGAYVLSDHASWLNFGNKAGLTMLFSGDPLLVNQYAYLPVNPARHPHVNAQAAARVETWLTGPRARALIDGYRLAGEQLFTFNASAQ